MTRLFPETKGGQFSEGETVSRLIEHSRLLVEDVYSVAHNRKLKGDIAIGDGLIRIGQNLERTHNLIIQLLTRGAN